MLGGGDGGPVWSVADGDGSLGGSAQIDSVDADPGPGDDQQVRGPVHHRRIERELADEGGEGALQVLVGVVDE